MGRHGSKSVALRGLLVGIVAMFGLVSGAQAERAAPSVPALEISKEPSADPATVGKRLTYTVTVTNTGGVPLSVVGLDSLPKEVTYVSATPSQGGPCRGNASGLVECPLGTIAPGLTATFTIVVIVRERPASGTITNRCSAFGTPPPGLPRAEAHCEVQTRVVEAAPKKCDCKGLDATVGYIRIGNPSWTMNLRWTLTCTGDAGRPCQGTIGNFRWSGSPLWLGSPRVIEVTRPRPPRVVRCNGKCGKRPTTGTARVSGVATRGKFKPRVRANQSATFSFTSFCGRKKVDFSFEIQFDSKGRLDRKRSDLNGNGKPDGQEKRTR
jgi:uncharacterized repeat protein (TIGR01451 family)